MMVFITNNRSLINSYLSIVTIRNSTICDIKEDKYSVFSLILSTFNIINSTFYGFEKDEPNPEAQIQIFQVLLNSHLFVSESNFR